MPDEKQQPAVAETKTDPQPAQPQPSEDETMRAKGFRKVRGAWRR